MPNLPPSFQTLGFKEPQLARKRMQMRNGKFLKPLMIGTEGASDTGKTEFLLSCPGPGLIICIDRGFDPVFDNPRPPKARRSDFGLKAIDIPLNLTAHQDTYIEYYKLCRDEFYKALANPDALTVAIDGDSDFYELQTLAEFGKVTKIWPTTRFGDLYAKRRAIIARAHDSGKIILGTNKLKPVYVTELNLDGSPKLDKTTGDPIKTRTDDWERQGFRDQAYLWNVQIRHLYQPASINKITKKEVPAQFGLRIVKCKVDIELVGTELWGNDCNFKGLVETIYPDVPLNQWGL